MITLIRILRPLSLVLVGVSAVANAQWGVRAIVPQFEKVTAKSLFNQTFLGVGLDLDITDRTSCGVDVTFDTNWDPYMQDQVSVPGNSSVDSYYEKIRVFGLQYRSQYHFSDNDVTSLYLGPTIGFRAVKEILSYHVQNSFYYDEHILDATGFIVPIGMRIGVRGGLEGGYADLYFGAAYAIGGGQAIGPQPFIQPESYLSSVNLQFGLAIGFGK